MDRKSAIIVAISIALIILWYPLMNRLYPRQPLPANSRSATQMVSGASVTSSVYTATNAIRAASVQTNTAVIEQLVVVTNETGYYTFTSRGGGLKLVELRHYPESVECQRKNAPAINNLAALNGRARLPVLAWAGNENFEGDSEFQLTPTAQGIRAEKQLPGGLTLIKEFEPQTNYLIRAKIRIENHSAAPVSLPVQEWLVGTAAPIATNETVQNIGVFWYNGSAATRVAEDWFQNRTMGCLPGTPRTEYFAGSSNVFWAAVHSQFFTLAAISRDPALQVRIRREAFSADGTVAPGSVPARYPASLIYGAATLPPGQSLERQITLYAGPKEYNRLARLGADWNNNLDLVMDFGRFFGFFAKALLLSMNGLRALGLHYGLAIILITFVIKMLFWPLTRASTRSMKRMQKLQPQMKAIQEKYKEDPKKMNTKLMEFMKEHKVSPIGGCLPIMLQIPVFIGFYQMLQSAIELRGASFLWACDLSKPDTVAVWGGFPVNPLPLIMGVTMLWQARLTPPSPGMDPVQQKIMKYMPLMFIAFLYKMSSGLTLYWTVQNLLTIMQMKLTRSDDDKAAPGTGPAVAPQPRPGNGPRKKK